jgi:hypothetical protein
MFRWPRHLYEPTALGLNEDIRCTYEVDKTKLGIDLPLRVDVASPIDVSAISNSPIVTTPSTEGKCGFHSVDFKLRVSNNQSDSASADLTLFLTTGPITGTGIRNSHNRTSRGMKTGRNVHARWMRFVEVARWTHLPFEK